MDFYCLLPVFLVLFVSIKTQRVIPSLFFGLIFAAFIAGKGEVSLFFHVLTKALSSTLDISTIIKTGLPSSDSNWSIFLFIFTLGIATAALNYSGASQAFTAHVSKWIRKPKDAERMSLVLSFLFFIDDYLSSLSIGNLMRPITDRCRIARAKLAFLIDAMAAPLAIVCPFSTWAGAILGFLSNGGVGIKNAEDILVIGSPMLIFFQIIPYIFYSFVIIFSSCFIVERGVRFGPMRRCEEHAAKTGDTGALDHLLEKETVLRNKKASVKDFFAVWFTLVFSLFFSMLYSGGWVFLGGERTALAAFQHSDIVFVLFLSSCLSLFCVFVYLFLRKIFTLGAFPALILNGVKTMRSAIIILVLAWSMGTILRHDLHAGEFISSSVLNHIRLSFLPSVVFAVALWITFATGSSWGTAALLFPVVLPSMVSFVTYEKAAVPVAMIPMFFPTLGALLSGCVAGDHISPISDTTIMTSLSTKMPHIDHVKTQIFYAIPCIFGTFVGYFLFGFEFSGIVCFIVGMLFSIVSIELLHLRAAKQADLQASRKMPATTAG